MHPLTPYVIFVCTYVCLYQCTYIFFSQRNLCAVVVYDIRSYTTFSAPSELFSSA